MVIIETLSNGARYTIVSAPAYGMVMVEAFCGGSHHGWRLTRGRVGALTRATGLAD